MREGGPPLTPPEEGGLGDKTITIKNNSVLWILRLLYWPVTVSALKYLP